MDWSLPSSLTGWAEFAANIATVLGIFSIALTFRASMRIQAKIALLREIEALRADPGVPFSSETKDVFNTVLHWARSGAFASGPGTEGFAALTSEGRKSYRSWLAHAVALFDLALLDGAANKDPQTRSEILAFLTRHSDALAWSWPRFGVVRLSARMRRMVAEVLRARVHE